MRKAELWAMEWYKNIRPDVMPTFMAAWLDGFETFQMRALEGLQKFPGINAEQLIKEIGEDEIEVRPAEAEDVRSELRVTERIEK